MSFLPAAILTFGIAWSINTDRLTVEAASSTLIIFELYGGGGSNNNGYKNDFAEIYNLSTSSVSLSGWSLQYAEASKSSWTNVALSGTVQGEGHFLIKLSGGNKGAALPLEDFSSSSINLGATSGKLALLNTTTKVGKYSDPRSDPTVTANVIDFVGYGSANAYETAPAPAPSTTTSISRGSFSDSDDNGADFGVATPSPFNSARGVAAYIMDAAPDSPEDTGGCDAYFPIARSKVTSLTAAQLDFFKTSSLTLSAKQRYEAWALNQGVSDPYVAGLGYLNPPLSQQERVETYVVLTSIISVMSIGYYVIKRVKQHPLI